MGKIKFIHNYEDIISMENLLQAWEEFICGKRNRMDVKIFRINLFDNVYKLHQELKDGKYKHGSYHHFKIIDPKPRDIHKATVRDRLLHHAIYRVLYPYFDQIFISDSYSCRLNKGTHKALNKFKRFSLSESKNYTKQCFILRCDITKFFASIDHNIIVRILEKYINDQKIIWLLKQVISSFHSKDKENIGLPLGNLTSQLLANIYMDKFDKFIKHELKTKYYIRYADDFVILSKDKERLKNLIFPIQLFLLNILNLQLHQSKILIKTMYSGIDFLGWIHFSNHRILRTSTKKRMFKNIELKKGKRETIQSYLELLKHGNTHKLKQKISKYVTFIQQ